MNAGAKMPGVNTPMNAGAKMPGVNTQKAYIVDNAGILNRETRLAILSVVMMEVGDIVVMETGSATTEVDIDLDALAKLNKDVLAHIYNIVLARRLALSQPAGASAVTVITEGSS